MMNGLIKRFVEYETPRYVRVHNPLLGIVLRSSQLGIITYIITYALLYEKGYQEWSGVESSVITKVKGTASSTQIQPMLWEQDSSHHHHLYVRVWDEADYVVPPAENGAFFITTNLNITPNQTQSECTEDPRIPGSRCKISNNTCIKGSYLLKGHGHMTGVCIPRDGLGAVYDGICEITAWCPVEIDRSPQNPAVLKEAEDFTVYIKNSIAFPRFGEHFKRNNLVLGEEPTIFHSELNPYGQIFRIGDLVELAGGNFTNMAVKGGVISITILWECDLDWDFLNYCLPRYRFSVLEETGWNFRHAYVHEYHRRTLIKAYGLKFLVQEKKTVAQKKYDTVEPKTQMMRTFLSQKKYKPEIGTESGSETLIIGHENKMGCENIMGLQNKMKHESKRGHEKLMGLDNEMRDENILGLKNMIGPEQTEEFLNEKSNNGTELDKTVMGQEEKIEEEEEKIEEEEEKIDEQEKTIVGQCENVISQENNGMGQSI
ncbi:P2X purinoceptor 4 isoform X2 [Eurytemora carolleeae]|uniref:P2X purinoceptor 4 isoform X2 n=1 Tax=Eurytemora carolleeae TaxID=1294199 RepID=UPI000C764212|nr:P2X purinoceptor 4 isoform X2 [Eurytemora carolleeae]|eukprot:XP_023325354.1 P2X purinoceptor 4-like isoform X2 [Eurytemora affinis]